MKNDNDLDIILFSTLLGTLAGFGFVAACYYFSRL